MNLNTFYFHFGEPLIQREERPWTITTAPNFPLNLRHPLIQRVQRQQDLIIHIQGAQQQEPVADRPRTFILMTVLTLMTVITVAVVKAIFQE